MTHHRFCYPHTVEIVDPRPAQATNRFFGGRARESQGQLANRRAGAPADRRQGERPPAVRR